MVKASNDDARVGILVGDVYDSLTVENCYVSGTIETTDGTNQIEAAGGLIGNVREKYSVEIQSCYADAEIKGTASKRFVGGLVGWTGGTTTIENSYAVVDMDVDKGDYIGGLVGCGSDSKVTISHSYAAGEALTKNPQPWRVFPATVRFPPVSAFSRRCDRSTGLAEKRELTRVTTALPAQSRENQMERF